MKKGKMIFSSLLIISLLFLSCTQVGAEGAMNWYCKRNAEHKQITLDSNMKFIEEFGGVYLDKAHGDNAEEKVVYLTFDAGYENGNVAKILDILRAEEVTGAFFILEHLIRNETELVMRMADEGHTVCNHTCSHKDMTKVSSKEEFGAELKALEDIYREYTGREMAKLYRPPEGRFDEKTLRFASELGYKTVFWSMAYADWDNNNQPSYETAMKKLTDNLHNGAIILLHPTSATNVSILPEFIKKLKAEGYRFGSLDEL